MPNLLETNITRVKGNKETVVERVSSGKPTLDNKEGCTCISSTERAYINKIRKLAAEKPNEVIIVNDTGDSIYAKLPWSWFPNVRAKTKRILSDEQKTIRAQRMIDARKNRKNIADNNDIEDDDVDDVDDDEDEDEDDDNEAKD